MWSKLLTIINTILIFSIVGFGLFFCQNFEISIDRNSNTINAVQTEMGNLSEEIELLKENPILSLGLETGDSLRVSDNGLVGYVDVEGFVLVTEGSIAEADADAADSVAVDTVAVLGFKNPSDMKIVEYINQQIEAETEYFSSDEDGFYYFPVGCVVEGAIAGESINVGSEKLEELTTSDVENMLGLRLFFANESVYVDSCESGIADVQVLS